MRSISHWIIGVLFIAIFSTKAHADNAWQGVDGWWNATHIPALDKSLFKRTLPVIQVKGKHFVDPEGKPVIFRGVSVADLDKINHDGRFTKAHFAKVKEWGANVIRLPIHPSAWRKHGITQYLAMLDQAIAWSNELGMYVILDWHSMGNLKSDMYTNTMYVTSKAETFDFWRRVSERYADIPAVAFYEIFNEPTVFNGRLGIVSWDEWKAINEEIITVIQAHNPRAISLVAGFNWAYDLKDVVKSPINRTNVAYVSHPYPQKVPAPYEKNWERDWGHVADHYPVFATELGYQLPGTKGAHIPVIDDGSYGPRITEYFDKKGVSWVAWVFDTDWSPQLIEDWNYTPTLQGKHFKQEMQSKNRQF